LTQEYKLRYASSNTYNLDETERLSLIGEKVLASMEKELLGPIIYGDLAAPAKTSPTLKTLLDKNLERADTGRPSILWQALVDSKGLSPTANQLELIETLVMNCALGDPKSDRFQYIAALVCKTDANFGDAHIGGSREFLTTSGTT
jgi:hypothetical protein